ncbi:unnamed protein product [Macrosiphum euphorbiae]|nr:unnamed protein product [Macrosiphum euphorbiae]
MGSSNIDVTLNTQGTAGNITGWLVSDVTDSDHRLLSYALDITTNRTQESKRFDVGRADWDCFSQELARSILTVRTTADLNVHASSLIDVITTVAKKAIPTRTGRRWNIKRQPWWTETLTFMRKRLNLAKRQGLMLHDRQAYNHLRNHYLQEIRSSKMTAWRNMSYDINVHTWGKAFRYAKNGPRVTGVTCSLSRADGTLTGTVDETMLSDNTARYLRSRRPRPGRVSATWTAKTTCSGQRTGSKKRNMANEAIKSSRTGRHNSRDA